MEGVEECKFLWGRGRREGHYINIRFSRCPQSSPPSPLAVREKAREENRLGVVCSGTLGWDDQQDLARIFGSSVVGQREF